MTVLKLWHEPTDLDSAWQIAQKVAKSGLAPSHLRTPEAAFIAMAMGAELGLTPMSSIRSVYVVDGKPSLPADLMVGLVIQSGSQSLWRYDVMTSECVKLTAQRGDGEPLTLEWTVKMAQAAGLMGKHNWKAYTRTMLKHRVDAEMCRALWPDITQGLYSPDEVTETQPTTVTVTTSAPAVDLAALPTVQSRQALPQEEAPPVEPIAETVDVWWEGIPKFGGGSASKAEGKGVSSERELYDYLKGGGKVDGMSTVAKGYLGDKFDEPETPDEGVYSDTILAEYAQAIEDARGQGMGPLDYLHSQVVESAEGIDGGLADEMLRNAAQALGVSLSSCTNEQMAEVLLKALA